MGLPGGSDGKEAACNARDLGSIPGSGRSPGEGNVIPNQGKLDWDLQAHCLSQGAKPKIT